MTVVRSTPVFGWQDQHGHCEIIYDNVRVPVSNLLGEEGARLRDRPGAAGPGPHPPLHARARRRRTGAGPDGRPRAATGSHSAVRWPSRAWSESQIAKSRNEIDQARLLCEKAAWTIDQHGNKAAHLLVSQIKAVAPQVACDVIDRAIQVHGAAGRQRRHPAGAAVRLAPRDADLRRPRRGAHAHHRARRNRPREVRIRRGGHLNDAASTNCPGAWNFRDVAESTGRAARPVLSVQRAEPPRRRRPRELRRLGITDVADLRSAREVARRGPGRCPTASTIHLLPFPDLAEDDRRRSAARARIHTDADRAARRRAGDEAASAT